MTRLFSIKKLRLTIIISLFLAVTTVNIGFKDNTKDLRQYPISSAVFADNQNKFNVIYMMPVIEKLNSNKFANHSVGFDSEGKIVVWIEPNEGLTLGEVEKFKLPYPSLSYYKLLIGKKILTLIPEVDSVWLNSAGNISCSCIHITRNKFIQSGLANLPMDKEGFFYSLEKDLSKYTDDHWSADVYEKAGFDWRYTRSLLNRLFGKRLKRFITDEPGTVEGALHLKIYGLPGDFKNIKALNEEIAKAFALSVGRYESQYWYCIVCCKLSYYHTDGRRLFDVEIWRDKFQKWFKDGFDYSQWYKYCQVTKYDKKLNFVTNEKIKPVRKVNPKKYSYFQVLNVIQSYPKVKMLMLGQSAKGLDAFLRIEDEDPATVYKREMDISLQLMKMGLHSVRFISEDNQGRTVIYLDRERYRLLMLFNPEEKYDFSPEIWPIMAKQCWAIKLK